MDQHKVVEIKFEDHYSLGDDWFDHVDESDLRILVCVGYLMKEDSKYYYVVNTYDTNNKNYQAGTAILKSCVISYVEYGNEVEITPARRTRRSK